MNKIDNLIELGEKATQGEWLHEIGHTQKESQIPYTQISGEHHAIMCNQFCADTKPNENAAFITVAANAREDIKKMRDFVRYVADFTLPLTDNPQQAYYEIYNLKQKAKQILEGQDND